MRHTVGHDDDVPFRDLTSLSIADAAAANAILPGTMDTAGNRESDPHADFSKWVQPSNVASLVLWLASDSGKDTNGAVIPIYGNL